MLTPETKRWFPYARPLPSPRLRLFCLPYAGGGASLFRPWASLLPSGVELWAAQPPGRETRFGEPAFTRAAAYVASLSEAVRPLLLDGVPYAFFGHSMGALMAFELARALRTQPVPQPRMLFVSARQAPHLPPHQRAHDLPEPEFIEYLRRLQGTPEAVLENEELRAIIFPLLRRDFEVLELYEYRPEPPLDVPLRALGGLEDRPVGLAQLEAWREHSRAFLGVRQLPGGHLYLNEDRERLIRAIVEDLPRG